MANDRITARCTEKGCPWGLTLFKYWSTPFLSYPNKGALEEMAVHWATHDHVLDFSLEGPGFRLITEAQDDR
jgi:hypothetical protein